jgi:GxxExxY protein
MNSIKTEYEDSELTSKIIGCAMRVHTIIGCGFPEVIYQRALAKELMKSAIVFLREFEMPISYDGDKIGSRKVDFLIEERVSVELKAVTRLEDAHLAQAKNYLEAFDLRVGLLINFGAKVLNLSG